MRSTLVTLGPWATVVLPLVIVIVYALALFWQWGEHRWGNAKPLSLRRALITLCPAVALGLLLFMLVNKLGPVPIKSWGTMLVVAFAAGTLYMSKWADRRVLTPADALDVALFALIGAIIGARVMFVLLDWGTYAAHPDKWLNVWEGGLSFHGGLLGAIIAGYLFARLRHKSFPAMADEIAPAIAIGYFFARFGCFLNGCCHGNRCDLPWAMVFPHGELPGVRVHPTQLYAMLSTTIILVILLKLRGKFPRPGHLFMAYLGLYSIYRFLVEFTRAGTTGKFMPGVPALTEGQFASILILLGAILTIALTWRKPAAAPEPVPAPAKPARKHRS